VALSVLDVSESGLRLLVKGPLSPGDEVEISLEGTAQAKPFKMTAQVAWALPTADGSYCVGVKFQRDLRYADLHLLAWM